MTEEKFRTGKTEAGAPVAAQHWPQVRRLSLLPGRPGIGGAAGMWILLVQSALGLHRLDVHDAALEEFIANAQAARDGGRVQDPRLDAGTGARLPDPAEPAKQAAVPKPEPVPAPSIARPLAEWHEDMHDKVWWFFPMDEAPYIGSPLDDDWPGYHTHFTDLPPLPVEPAPALAAGPDLNGMALAKSRRAAQEERRAGEDAAKRTAQP